MTYANPNALISTDDLARQMSAPDVRIVDATSFMPSAKRDARKEYEAAHIPGAVYFDVNDIADTATDLPHMLPSPEKFSSKVRKLGLGDGSRIVVYDANGGFLAAHRVWWMFRVFGHRDIAVLDGGLLKWRRENRPLTDDRTIPRERHFTARLDHSLVRGFDQVRANMESRREQLVDARSPGRFKGTEAEPRPGLRGGHIPGSLNVPFNALLDPKQDFIMRPAAEIAAAFAAAGVDIKKPLAATCGSGITACTLAFGLFLIGRERTAVYDGSWTEWGARTDVPVET
ncbi:MAG: 3-mercaptopyruvate sulfurtransferase [Alphaproteobacteria bacterium]|nr:3-mercaptopyruvate sulfurtransferase [Alphaproteobacteria bacterium]